MGKMAVVDREARKNYIKELQAVFSHCDEGNKKHLSRRELKLAVVCLFGYKPSKLEVNELIRKHAAFKISTSFETGDDIDFDTFIRMMESKIKVRDEDDEIRQAFLSFDSSCKGFITREDLGTVLNRLMPHMPQQRIDAMFREIDRDGDGRVSYRDFDFMMKYRLDR